jgi:Zn-dependent protease
MVATAAGSAPAPGVLGESAWRIARVSGIDIALDRSWVLIFVLITLSVAGQLEASLPNVARTACYAAALAVACAFFASIVLHELGHSLVAQSLGIRVRSITLFLFGGVALLESEPKRPGHEVAVALAGPAVSIGLAAAFAAVGGTLGEATLAGAGARWLARVNLALGVFNLAPGFPLDGGRVLRGLLWAATGSFARATRIASAAGAGIAGLLMFAGVLVAFASRDWISGLWLVFLGWFLLNASRSAVGALELERILGGVRVREVLEPALHATVAPGASVAELVSARVLRSGLRTLWVVDPASGRLLGIATLRELASLPQAARETTRVESIMLPAARAVSISPGETALVGMQRLAAAGVNQLPVLEDGRLVGALTRERLLGLLQAGLWLGEAQAPA